MSSSSSQKVDRVLKLARRIEGDVCERKLKPGDRYLNTDETARMLGVSANAASKALQLLVKRNYLKRTQRLGTFVAPKAGDPEENPLGRVHLLTSDRQMAVEGVFESGTLLGLQSELPNTRIQFDAVTSDDEQRKLDELINEALRSRELQGFLLAASSLGMQRAVAASGLPGVVLGHRYPSISGIPFFDADQGQVGRLLAEYILGKGHRRIVLLLLEHLFPGDHCIINAIKRAADEAGLPPGGVQLQCLPSDHEVALDVVRRVLGEAEKRPGIIARSRLMADVAMEVVKARNLVPQQNVAIAASDHTLQRSRVEPPYPYIRWAISHAEHGAELGRMLRERASGRQVEDEVSPVALAMPRTP